MDSIFNYLRIIYQLFINREIYFVGKEELNLANNKIVKYRKPFRPRVATLILIIIIIYVVAVAWNYFTKEHISIYEVNETSIADDSTITGFILRNEVVVNSEKSGYINFYHADQSKVGKNEVVYTIDSNGAVSDILNNVEADSMTTTADITNMREVISDFYLNYNSAAYYTVKDFHYNVENTIFEQSRDNLYSDLKKQLSENNIEGEFIKSKAATSGIISYSIDGYENTKLENITPELFEKVASVERNQLSSSEKIDQDTPVYKLVTDEKWNIIFPVSDELLSKLGSLTTVRVTIKKDNISFNTNLTIQNNNGHNFAVLSTSRFMGRYLNDRFIDIELNLNAASGFKIPNSSILSKKMTMIPENMTTTGGESAEKGVLKLVYNTEDGSSSKEFVSLADASVSDGYYYVNESVLKPGDTLINPSDNKAFTLQNVSTKEGVYCVNTGYCQFKEIEKVYENNEYTIVSPDTPGGISNFDHIVVNPEKINENDFVE